MLLPIFLTACNSYDEPDGGTREKRVIEFAKPFVNRATRAETADPSVPFSEFRVYGFVHRPDSYIFDGELVRRQSDGKWLCDRAEYWYPDQTYYFSGIAPADSKGMQFTPAKKGNGTMSGGGTITYDIGPAGGKEDLLYSFEMLRTPDVIPEYMPAVQLEFDHVLSKVEFVFYNDLISPRYFINVNWIQIDGAYRSGAINMEIPEAKWTPTDSATTYVGVGSVPYIHTDRPSTSAPVYILPVYRKDMGIMLKTQVFEAKEDFGNEGFEITPEETLTAAFPKIDLKPGRTYKLICHLRPDNVEGDDGQPLRPISFTVEVSKWGEIFPETP